MRKLIWGLITVLALAGCGGGDSAEKYVQEGMAHFQKQEYDQAIASYEKAVKLEPKAAAAYNLLGMAYRFKYNQLGSPENRAKEIAAFEKAMEVDPKFWVAMINLGATHYHQGDKVKAAPLFKKALELNPGHPEKAQIEKMMAETPELTHAEIGKMSDEELIAELVKAKFELAQLQSQLAQYMNKTYPSTQSGMGECLRDEVFLQGVLEPKAKKALVKTNAIIDEIKRRGLQLK
ncbi:MAG: tetratricopeptide repeat protein [Deltaproteobacteria bacterium]|nr:tetratricopeptide repeat protein [Deltaproteobacteria bacterium]